MRILVTGGAGYIGSHTAKALARAGCEPVVLDNLSTGHRWAVRWGPLVEGDLADAALVRRTLRDHRVQAVIHFAASAYVGESLQHPRRYFRNNLVNTLSLLDAMLDVGVRHIVFSSTCATYGEPLAVPIGEDHPQRPVNPYGESKLAVERVLHWYGDAYGLGWMSLRYFNAAGADPDGETGADHHPETRIIPLAIKTALGQLPRLVIHGGDYPTADGTAVRDYVHVTDLADAHVLGLEYLIGGGPSPALNLGTGRGHSVSEVIRAVERAGRREVRRHVGERREGDPATLVADTTRATRLLGWQPQHSDLDEIVETAWRWYASLGGEARRGVSIEAGAGSHGR